jgi:hypothetical protein
MVMALLTLSAVIWFDRKLERGPAGLAIFLTATFYMCVFNPRVEPNTYAMIAVPAGLAIALLWREERGGALASVLSMTLFADRAERRRSPCARFPLPLVPADRGHFHCRFADLVVLGQGTGQGGE